MSEVVSLRLTDDEWNRVPDVALTGVRRVTQAFLPAIVDGGSVVNISSLAAQLSMEHLPAYSASKGGLDAFTRASAKELAPRSV